MPQLLRASNPRCAWSDACHVLVAWTSSHADHRSALNPRTTPPTKPLCAATNQTIARLGVLPFQLATAAALGGEKGSKEVHENRSSELPHHQAGTRSTISMWPRCLHRTASPWPRPYIDQIWQKMCESGGSTSHLTMISLVNHQHYRLNDRSIFSFYAICCTYCMFSKASKLIHS